MKDNLILICMYLLASLLGFGRAICESRRIASRFKGQMDTSAFQVDDPIENVRKEEAQHQHGHFGSALQEIATFASQTNNIELDCICYVFGVSSK